MNMAEDETVTDAEVDDEMATTIALAVDGEDHTLGNVLRDVMWKHPHVQLASYTQEHPSSSEVIIQCQTSGIISAEQGVVEALQIAKQMLGHIETTMNSAVDKFKEEAGGSDGMR